MSSFLLELIALLWNIRFQNKNILKITANRLLKFKFEESQCHPTFLNSLYFHEEKRSSSLVRSWENNKWPNLPLTIFSWTLSGTPTTLPPELPYSQDRLLPTAAAWPSTLSTDQHSDSLLPFILRANRRDISAYREHLWWLILTFWQYSSDIWRKGEVGRAGSHNVTPRELRRNCRVFIFYNALISLAKVYLPE